MGLTWYSDSAASSTTTTTTVNTEVYAKLSFRSPDVRAVYVDWDDGTSNKIDEANFQWATTTEPVKDIVLSHTYNKTGSVATNTFNPIVQTINNDGIVSQYYGADSSNTDVTPFNTLASVSGLRVNDSAPTAIMRVENTSFNSGIDNSILEIEGGQKVYLAIAPTLTRAELTGTIQEIQVSVEGVVARNKYNSNSGTEAQLALGADISQETTTFPVDFTVAANQYGVYDFWSVMHPNENGVFNKILKVSYDSCKSVGTTAANAGTDYTTNEVFNRFKIFLVTKANDGEYYPITYVTAGSPVKSVDDNMRYTTLEMGQSRAAAANVALSNYRYDNGKMWYSPVNQWALSTNILGTGTKQTASSKQLHYSYILNPEGVNSVAAGQAVFGSGADFKWYKQSDADNQIRTNQVALDDYGRFFTQYHDVRASVEAASTEGSVITTNQPEVLYCKPCPSWTSVANATDTPLSDQSSNMKNNGSGTIFKLASVNSVAVKDLAGEDVDENHGEKEYLLLTFDSKTNKVFINASTFVRGLGYDPDSFDVDVNGFKIAGVEYLRVDDAGTKIQNAYWKPLLFEDTTKISREIADSDKYVDKSGSFAKSGYITFDMPTDWSAISATNLCGGKFNTTANSLGSCTAAGFDDVTVTGTAATTAGGVTGYGDGFVSVALAAASDKTQVETIGGASDIGAYKYIFITKTGTGSGSAFWIASGASNGYNASAGSHGTLYLQVGTATSPGGATTNSNLVLPNGTVTGTIRRINIYDVVNGANKVYQDVPTNTNLNNALLVTAGMDTYNATSPSYFQNLYNLTNFTSTSFATNDKYLLKLTLSGTTLDGTADNACPEINNVFDGNQGDSAIIKNVDDSAYNLNSLAITSDISVGRGGQYFKAITRKGKVHIVKTGISLTEIGFSSVALGDESTGTVATEGASTLYGHLHKIRNIQADAVPVYWDEPQKDGTFVRFWGIISNVNETRGVGGPRATMNYTFTLIVKDIALLQNNGMLMTDRFPLGGLKNDRDYS